MARRRRQKQGVFKKAAKAVKKELSFKPMFRRAAKRRQWYFG